MDYISLAKPRCVALSLVATSAAMLIAVSDLPPLSLIFWALFGVALAAGGAFSLNNYFDRDIDRLMIRTQRRPLPSGRLKPSRALAFGLSLCGASVFELALLVNPLSASLAGMGIVYYVFLYTICLKRMTPQSTLIGGAAGAAPLLVGWAASANGLSAPALYLGAIVLFWTPPHFWALALLRRSEYLRAGIPSPPVAMGDGEARRQILLYTMALVALSLLLVPARIMGLSYLVLASALGAVLTALAVRLARLGSDDAALVLYRYSSIYLALLLAAMVFDRAIWPSLHLMMTRWG